MWMTIAIVLYVLGVVYAIDDNWRSIKVAWYTVILPIFWPIVVISAIMVIGWLELTDWIRYQCHCYGSK